MCGVNALEYLEETRIKVFIRDATFLQQWQLAKLMVAQPRQTPPSYNRWNKPLIGMYACNIDATFSNNKIGIGMCL